jgi:outer membrane lipoprotein-sorting protein
MMKKLTAFARLLGVFFLLALPPAQATGLSAQEIVKRADEARGPSGDVSFRVEVKDFGAGALLRTTRYHVYSKGGKYVLVETEYPERLQGRKLLMRDEDLWLYLPSTKQPTRISFQQRLTGEVSNGDLSKTSFHTDYRPKLLGSEQIKHESFYKLELFAKEKNATYRKIRLWVNTKNFHPLRAEYFAISGKLLKTSNFSEPKPVLGQDRMTQVAIRDAVDPTRKSQLKYFDYRRETLDASFFSKESLP